MKEIENIETIGTGESTQTSQSTPISVCQPELIKAASTTNPTVSGECHDRVGEGPGGPRTQLGKKRSSRNAMRYGRVLDVTLIKGGSRQNWPSIIENLIAASGDGEVQAAFRMVLEEGFGVAPLAVPSFSELSDYDGLPPPSDLEDLEFE
jgi:hypothetical protein